MGSNNELGIDNIVDLREDLEDMLLQLEGEGEYTGSILLNLAEFEYIISLINKDLEVKRDG